METVIKFAFVLTFAIRMIGTAQNIKSFTLETIKLESPIDLFPDFQKIDNLPEKSIPESYLPKRSDRFYYASSNIYTYLNQEVKHLILTVDSTRKVLSVDIVLAYNNDILEKMTEKYGSWLVASSIGHNSDEQLGDLYSQGVFVWKYNDVGLINMMINRNENLFLEDLVVVKYSKKR